MPELAILLRRRVRTGLFLTAAFLASCGGQPSPAPEPGPTEQLATTESAQSPTALPVPALPDLVVNSVTVAWEVFGDCADYETAFLTVEIEISNIGGGSAGPFEIAIGPFQSELIDDGLEPGKSRLLEVPTFMDVEEGSRLDRQPLVVEVDWVDEIREIDETNNSRRIQPELPLGIYLCPTPQPLLPADLGPIPLLQPGEPLNFQRIDMVDASRGWGIVGIAFDDQHIVRTIDGGKTWMDVSPPELAYGVEGCGAQASMQAVDSSTAWVGYMNAYYDPSDPSCWQEPVTDLWKTQDGGRTWRLGSFVQRGLDTGGDGSGFPLLEFVDSQYGWAWRAFFLGAGSTGNEFYQTVDGGRTWQLFPEAYLFRITGLDFRDLKHGWVTQSYGFGYLPPFSLGQTHDGGSTWEFSDVPLPGDEASLYNCDIRSPELRSSTAGRIIMECSTNDGEPRWFTYDTTDSGRTWQIGPIPDQPDQFISAAVGWKREYAEEPEDTVLDIETWDLFWTYNGGRSWSKTGTVSLAYGTNFDFVSPQIGWAVTRLSENENTLIQTVDGGRMWEPMQPVTVETPTPDDRGQPLRISPLAELQPLSSQTVEDLDLLQELPAAGVAALAVSIDRDLLLTGNQDGTLTLWDLTGAHYARVVRLHSDWIYDVAVAEQAGLVPNLFATASKDGSLRFIRFYGYAELGTISVAGGEVASVVATGDERAFASAGQDGSIRIWEPGEFSYDAVNPPSAELLGHTAWVWDLALSPDDHTLASASADRTIRLWDLVQAEPLGTLTAHNATVGTLAFSPTGGRMASAGWDGSVVLWDTETWQPLQVSNEHRGRVYAVAFSRDGTVFATGATDGELILWDAENGEPIANIEAGGGAVRALLFSPDGTLLFTASDDGYLRLWGVQP